MMQQQYLGTEAMKVQSPVFNHNIVFQSSSRQSGMGPDDATTVFRYRGSAELLVPGRVTAVASIPQGSMTVPIEPAMLLGQPDIQQISVKTSSKGIIDLEEQFQDVWCQTTHWVRALRLSDDCHSYNVQLKLHPAYQRPCTNALKTCQIPKLILQAVRPIDAGQELLLWFSEDILAMLQIVFLTPANIQGQKKYVCTRCSALYESPNPLKLHMTLGCGKLGISTLWRRLSSAMHESRYNVPREEVFNFQLSVGQEMIKQKTAMDLTVTNPNLSEKLYRPYEPSAFKPFKKEETDFLNLQPPLTPPSSILPVCYDPCLHLQQPVYNDEAQIETLVSSLGKSRQGHICLYCGKCYSRKYGLKIHIRTHTGYKPLRCKFCSRPFGDPSNLNKHVRLHAEGNTPYKCDLCGKILVRRRDLERHLKSRHMIETHPGLNILSDSPDGGKEASDEETRINSN